MATRFMELLEPHQRAGRLVCPGLDLGMDTVPPSIMRRSDTDTPHRHPLYLFGCELADGLYPISGCFKLNSAPFEAAGPDGLRAMQMVVEYIRAHKPDIPIIYDAKRGDIGSTNEYYGVAAFDVYGFDAMTVSPYPGNEKGLDALLTAYADKMFFVLGVTSNPGSNDLQRLGVAPAVGEVATETLWQRVAKLSARFWDKSDNVGLVAGATYPKDLQGARHILGPLRPILAPGLGAQGGDIYEALRANFSPTPGPVILNNSREIIRAAKKADEAGDPSYIDAAVSAATAMHQAVRFNLSQLGIEVATDG